MFLLAHNSINNNLFVQGQGEKNHIVMDIFNGSAVSRLLSIQTGMNESLIVELSRPKKTKKRLSVLISDGQQRFKGYLEITERTKDVEKLMKKYSRPSLRVKITEHITHFQHNEPKEIQILNFELINEVKLQAFRPLKLEHEPLRPINFQNDVPFSRVEQHTPVKYSQTANNNQNLNIKYNCTTPDDRQTANNRENPLEAVIKANLKNNSTRKLKIQSRSDNQNTEAQSQPQKHESHQRIMDLYESYYNWAIVVRVVDADYKQFISKQGKMIKLLNIELIDREGSMITAIFFGDGGKAKYTAIQKGKTYRISRGKISVDSFNKHKRDHESKYSITLNKDSEFAILQDDPDIPYCRNNWLRLTQIHQNFNPNHLFNFIAILVDIQQTVEIPRANKTLIIQKLYVGDPATGMTHQVTIWDNHVMVDPSLLGKSILLKKFKLSNFRNQITLNSGINSQILPHNFFTEYEGRCNFNVPQYSNNSSVVKTIKEVSEELQGVQVNYTIYSTIEVWVKQMGFDKKWFYDACPACRKSCGNNSTSRCENCHAPIDQAIKCFMLNLKLADLSGSIDVTAFSDSASVFLKDMPMEALFPMSNRELCEYAESHYYYEQYRIQIKSVRDMLALQKHSLMGMPVPVNVNETLQRNMKRIAIMGEELASFDVYAR